MKIRFGYFLVMAFFLSVVSCSFSDIREIELAENDNAEFAIPLLSDQTTIEDLLEGGADSSALVLYPDGSMSLVYQSDVVTQTADAVFGTLPTLPLILENDTTVQMLTLVNNLVIYEGQVKAGLLAIQFIQDVQYVGSIVTFTLPQLMKDNQPFRQSIRLDLSDDMSRAEAIIEADLDGYYLDLDNKGIVTIMKTVDQTGAPVDGTKGGGYISGLAFSHVIGYWGQTNFDFPKDTVEIDFFKNKALIGEVHFGAPRLTTYVINSFGFPVQSVVNGITVQDIDGSSADLQSPILDTGFPFSYPAIDDIGGKTITSFDFDNTNSNIKDILDFRPERVIYDIDILANPDNDTTITGFATDSSFFTIAMRAELPFYGSAIGFANEREFYVDFNALNDVSAAEFKLITDNNIPLGGDLQLYFLDENWAIFDSLITDGLNPIFLAAPVDVSGHSSGPIEEVKYISIPEDRMGPIIAKTRKIKMVVKFTTSENGTVPVHINAKDSFSIKLGVKTKVQF